MKKYLLGKTALLIGGAGIVVSTIAISPVLAEGAVADAGGKMIKTHLDRQSGEGKHFIDGKMGDKALEVISEKLAISVEELQEMFKDADSRDEIHSAMMEIRGERDSEHMEKAAERFGISVEELQAAKGDHELMQKYTQQFRDEHMSEVADKLDMTVQDLESAMDDEESREAIHEQMEELGIGHGGADGDHKNHDKEAMKKMHSMHESR